MRLTIICGWWCTHQTDVEDVLTKSDEDGVLTEGDEDGVLTKGDEESAAHEVGQELRDVVDDGRHAEESGGPAQVLSIKSQHTAHVNPAHS